MATEKFHNQLKESLGQDCIALNDYVVYVKDKDHIYQVINVKNTHLCYSDNVCTLELRAIDVDELTYLGLLQHNVNPNEVIRIPNFAYLLECKSKVDKSKISIWTKIKHYFDLD